MPPLTSADLVPRAATPLIDAVAVAIGTTKQDYADHDRVVMVIMTDGLENASREFTLAQLRDLISERMVARWDFVFVGAGIDAYADSRRFGLNDAVTMSYAANDLRASRAAYRSVARRSEGDFKSGAGRGFTDAEKRAADDQFAPKRDS